RYGQLKTTPAHLHRALTHGPEGVTAVLNAYDPMVDALGEDLPRVTYAGVEAPELLQPQLSHGADAKFCPRCGSPFIFEGVYFGHVGHYRCPRGDFERPTPEIAVTALEIDGIDEMRLTVRAGSESAAVRVPLSGLYKVYNVVLELAATRAIGGPLGEAEWTLGDFARPFGRLE